MERLTTFARKSGEIEIGLSFSLHSIRINMVYLNCLQKSIAASVCGQELPLAVLDYIRHNDIPILEGCDKVLSKYQEELLTAESFAEFCDVMGEAV